MSLCQSIDTLAMAFLDDELAAEERRELELHLIDCSGCRQHVETERAELQMMRKALAAPPAPDMFKARLARALDNEDREASRVESQRKRSLLGRMLLPGAAMVAAAAAIVVFVAIKPASTLRWSLSAGASSRPRPVPSPNALIATASTMSRSAP